MKITFKNSKILMINGRTLTPVPGQGPEPGLHYVYTSSEGHGSISASPMSGKKDTLITLTNTPDQNYIFSKYTLNNVDLTGSSFLMPDDDAYVRGYFQPDVRTITVTQPSHGTITAPASAQVGSTVTLSCTPEAYYELEYFTVNGVAIVGNTFTMPASDVTVSASLEEMHGGSDVLYTNLPKSLLRDWSNPVVSNFSNTRRYVLFHQILEWNTRVTTYASGNTTGYYNITWGDTTILNAEQFLAMNPSMNIKRLFINGVSLQDLVLSGSTYKLIYDQVDKMIYLYRDGVLEYSTHLDLSEVGNNISIDSYRATLGYNQAFVYHTDIAVATFDMLNDALAYTPS